MSMERPHVQDAQAHLPAAAGPDLDHGAVGNRRGIGRRILMVASVLLLGAALGIGYWRHYAPYAQVMATAQRTEEPTLEVRTALARANPRIVSVRLPAITQAFAQANIYARASGYITRREVDIGSHIKTGQLLVRHRGEQRLLRRPGGDQGASLPFITAHSQLRDHSVLQPRFEKVAAR
jgi:multidrug efflux pump subunit AcrA (membrane-fusion protein)